MPIVNPAIAEITKAMTSAVAPVFLISGAGTLLGGMAIRYGRVIDRSRTVLKEYREMVRSPDRLRTAEDELRVLYRRAKLLRTTVILNAAAIFCIAICIFVIFASLMLDFALPYVVPVMFSLGLLLIILSLALFIEDFAISLGALKQEIRAVLHRDIFVEPPTPSQPEAPAS